MQDFVNYQEMVESTIDLKEIKNQLYLIKPSFDPDLQGNYTNHLFIIFLSEEIFS